MDLDRVGEHVDVAKVSSLGELREMLNSQVAKYLVCGRRVIVFPYNMNHASIIASLVLQEDTMIYGGKCSLQTGKHINKSTAVAEPSGDFSLLQYTEIEVFTSRVTQAVQRASVPNHTQSSRKRYSYRRRGD